MKKVKFKKILKHIFIGWVSLTIILFVGAIIKYNSELNGYINTKDNVIQTNKNIALTNETEVYILGSMHFETNSFKRDDLFTYVNKVSPSIILYESDKQTVNRMVNRTDFFNQFMNAFQNGKRVENFVALKYLKHHPKASVIGYEWEERDQFHFEHSYQKKSSELLGKVLTFNKKGTLSDKESKIINDFLSIDKKYFNIGNSKTIYDFNNPIADSIIRIRQEFVYNKIPKILSTKELSDDLKEFIPIHANYWDTRNMAMVNNIIKQIKNNPNKKIVVFTGYSHRYYLIDELKKREEELGFSVKPI